MIHIIRLIERRRRRAAEPSRLAVGALIASAVLLTIGMAVLSGRSANAQNLAENRAQDSVAPARAAQDALAQLIAGDYAGLHARFNAEMAAAVSADQLRAGWEALDPAVGPLQKQGEPTVQTRDNEALVTIPLMFERGQLNAFIAFDGERRISGFALRPPKAAAAQTPTVPEGANYAESELRIGEASDGLAATLTMPNGRGPFAAVVLVHGSGPQDRDETIGPNKVFLDIARGLAERGVAVLRYEKRTHAHPQAYMAGGPTIDRETTDDAVAAIALLRAQTGVDPRRVYVLGHSLGGMMAPRIAQRAPETAGLILLAAPSRSLLDILIEQNRRLALLNDGKVSDDENRSIMRLTDGVKAVREGREPSDPQALMGMPADYWRSVEAVDPIAEAASIPQPMLILQGARDIQVVDADWQRWRGAFHATPRVEFKLYETLNHLAIEGEGSVEDYARPGRVSVDLIADVAAWIGRQGAAKKR